MGQKDLFSSNSWTCRSMGYHEVTVGVAEVGLFPLDWISAILENVAGWFVELL